MKKILSCVITWVALFTSSVFALSSIASKEAIYWDLFLESSNLEYTPPNWFQPHSLETAPDYAEYWIHEVLPFEQDRFEDIYLVIPQLGLITPVVPIPKWSSDYNDMVSGKEIWINKYLESGIIEYVNSVQPWHWGKRVDFGHSNHFVNHAWRYKTIFASLMALDPGDQAWYFVKNSTGQYDLHRYEVTASYNTVPTNVSPLKWDGDGADALIFWCTHGLDGRWMIEATYMWEPMAKPVPYVDPYADLDSTQKRRVDNAVRKINRLRPNLKSYTIVQLIKLIDHIRETKSLSEAQELLLNYIEDRLVMIYPS